MKNLFLGILLLIFPFADKLYGQDCASCGIANWVKVVQSGNTVTYSVPALNGANYFWDVAGGLKILSGQGTNSVTVVVNSDGNISVARYGLGTNCSNTAAIKTAKLLSLSNQCDLFSAIATPLAEAVFFDWYIEGTFIIRTTSASIIDGFPVNGVMLGNAKLFELRSRYVGAKSICIQMMNGNGQPVSGTFCTDIKSCPLEISVNECAGCANPVISVRSVFAATAYKWYLNDVWIKTTDLPRFNNLACIGALKNEQLAVLNLFGWLRYRDQFGQKPLTLCVEAIDGSGSMVPNTLRTCMALSECVSTGVAGGNSGGGSGGGGGTGGGGSGGGGGGGIGGEVIMQEAMQSKIYPNPSSNELMISFDGKETESKPFQVKMFNSNGTEVKSLEITSPNQKVFIGDLPKDNYVVKIISGKKVETKRIVVQ